MDLVQLLMSLAEDLGCITYILICECCTKTDMYKVICIRLSLCISAGLTELSVNF